MKINLLSAFYEFLCGFLNYLLIEMIFIVVIIIFLYAAIDLELPSPFFISTAPNPPSTNLSLWIMIGPLLGGVLSILKALPRPTIIIKEKNGWPV